jgi:hypothetical protein
MVGGGRGEGVESVLFGALKDANGHVHHSIAFVDARAFTVLQNIIIWHLHPRPIQNSPSNSSSAPTSFALISFASAGEGGGTRTLTHSS